MTHQYTTSTSLDPSVSSVSNRKEQYPTRSSWSKSTETLPFPFRSCAEGNAPGMASVSEEEEWVDGWRRRRYRVEGSNSSSRLDDSVYMTEEPAILLDQHVRLQTDNGKGMGGTDIEAMLSSYSA